jgi:hypothetical protein
VSRGITADLWGFKGVSRHHGGFMGIQGCLLASRRIYEDIKGVSWHHGGFMRIQGDIKVSPGITADLCRYLGIAWHHGGFM